MRPRIRAVEGGVAPGAGPDRTRADDEQPAHPLRLHGAQHRAGQPGRDPGVLAAARAEPRQDRVPAGHGGAQRLRVGEVRAEHLQPMRP